ncbi:MFS transporter [Chloroflexota bacterium]
MNRRIFAVLALAVFSSMLGAGIIAPLLPIYVDSFGASGLWLGIIFSGFSFSRALLMPFWGRLSDRFGRRPFLVFGLLAVTISSLGYVGANSIYALLLVRLIHGMASAAVMPIAQAYMGDICPKGQEGKWMGFFMAAFFTGFGSGPLLGGILTDHFGMNVAFYTMGALNLIALLLNVVLIPEAQQRKTTTRSNRSFKEIGKSGVVRGLFSLRLTFALARGAFVSFIPIFAGIQLKLSPTQIGLLVGVSMLSMSVLQSVAGRLADRFNRTLLIIVGFVINPILYMALIPFTTNFYQLLSLSILAGIGGAVGIPALSAMGVGEGRKFGMGSTVALLSMGMSIGMTLGPIIGGLVSDMLSTISVFYFGSIVGIIGIVSFICFSKT